MKKKPATRKVLFFNAVMTCAIFLLMVPFSHFHGLGFLNGKLYDTLFTIRRWSPEKRDNVVIVCIDQKSIDYYHEESGLGWPWPRDFHAQLVRYLSACGVKAVIFDVIFSEPDIIRVHSGDTDIDFGEAIEQSKRTYLSASLQDSTTHINPYDRSVFLTDSDYYNGLRLTNHETLVFPLRSLSYGAAGVGLVNFAPESDNIIRRYNLAFKFRNEYIPTIGMRIARDFLDDSLFRSRFYDRTGTFVDNTGMVLINWYGRSDTEGGVFTYYSYHGVLESSILELQGKQPLIKREAFRDKFVIIGTNAPGLGDMKSTPFSSAHTLYPGMEIHATAIENFLTGDFMRRIPLWITALILAATAAVLFLVHTTFKNLRIFIAFYFIIVALELVLTYGLLKNNLWLPGADLAINGTLVFAGLVISGYLTENREKRLLRKQFERYVNDAVLEEIMANPSAVDVEGKTLIATVLASDIAGFTTISEQMLPREVVSRLNDYLSEVSESLIENKAFINKYIGDAILAVFGAFEEGDHRKNACLGAINAQTIINRKIDEAVKAGQTPFVTRFGLTTGELTLGNIGSRRKTEYTVIGDTVNSAFRLEGLNKYYNTRILVSEYTRDEVQDLFEFRFIDTIRYKGKTKPVRVYQLLGLKGEVDGETLRIRDDLEAALRLYCGGQFEEALQVFSRLTEGGDVSSEVFRDRCEEFIASPPPEWNGVWVMKSK